MIRLRRRPRRGMAAVIPLVPSWKDAAYKPHCKHCENSLCRDPLTGKMRPSNHRAYCPCQDSR